MKTMSKSKSVEDSDAVKLAANKLGALGVIVFDAIEKSAQQLSPSASAILLTLKYWPNLTATQVAEIAGVSQPTSSRLISGLERQGLVERALQEGKFVPLRLSASGMKAASALQEARLGALQLLLSGLSDREQTQFASLLDRLLSDATSSRAFARQSCRFCEHKICIGKKCPIGTRACEMDSASDGKAV